MKKEIQKNKIASAYGPWDNQTLKQNRALGSEIIATLTSGRQF